MEKYRSTKGQDSSENAQGGVAKAGYSGLQDHGRRLAEAILAQRAKWFAISRPLDPKLQVLTLSGNHHARLKARGTDEDQKTDAK